MKLADLVAEGRQLQLPSLLLEPKGSGDPAAIWYGHYGLKPSADGHHCWLSVNAKFIPDCKLKGWLKVYTNDKTYRGGKVLISKVRPKSPGIELFARAIEVLPPLYVLRAKGSQRFQDWVRAEKVNFNASRLTPPLKSYVAKQIDEDPFTWPDSYCRLGGWSSWENGWRDFQSGKLLIQTYKDSEPWVEVWQLDSGELRVVQYIT